MPFLGAEVLFMKQLCGSGNCRRFQGERRPRCAVPGLRLCRTCCARVRADIAELPRLYEECESALAQFPFVLDHKVRGGERRGLNLNEAAVNARLNMKSVLATWSGMVADERRLSKLARRDVAHLVTFLMVHLEWLLTHPAAPDFVDEIAVIATTARRASRSGPALHLDLGQCVQDSCDGAMFAARSGQDASSSLQVRCEAGHVWRPQEWLLLARRVRQGNSDPGRQGSRTPDGPAMTGGRIGT